MAPALATAAFVPSKQTQPLLGWNPFPKRGSAREKCFYLFRYKNFCYQFQANIGCLVIKFTLLAHEIVAGH